MPSSSIDNTAAFARRAGADIGRSPAAPTVRQLIDTHALIPHFQPIAQLVDGTVYGHEALIRTPPGCPWENPDALFTAAREEDLSTPLEIECVRLALYEWNRYRRGGKLFINLSASALVTAMAQFDIESILTVARGGAIAKSGLVVELTEHERVKDFDALANAVRRLRRHGVQIALDDFGDGRSSLRLWSELKPEIVKIDKYFTHGLSQHAEKLQTLRALQQISQTLGAALVAEGIETASELHLVRDLGIRFGQGWLIGRPAATPTDEALQEALDVVRSKDLAVFPERRRNTQQRAAPSTLLEESAPVTQQMSNQELFDRFAGDERIRALAIVEDGRPIGLVGRQQFIARYSKPYFKELFGRKPCTSFANLKPRIVEIDADIDDLTTVLTGEDQRYLAEGFIITEGGRYRGLGSGEHLVRKVTESRIEAARHANPLTLLPGNIPITQHIQRLLLSGREFVACYGDLNQFKPFNDIYGYWRGDEMILLAARCITAQADPGRDFVGHVGGDDFLVLFQSDNWDQRCEAICGTFNAQAAALYDEDARQAGGLIAEDRHGLLRFHPLTTISIGAFRVASGASLSAEQVASGAAVAKRHAKATRVGVYLAATITA